MKWFGMYSGFGKGQGGWQMNELSEWHGTMILIVMAAFFIVSSMIMLWYFLKCIKVWKCSYGRCKYHNCCFKYKETYTKEDIERIQKLTDAL